MNTTDAQQGQELPEDTETAESTLRSNVPPVAHWINIVAIPVAVATVLMSLQDVQSPVRVWFTVFLFVLGAGSGLTQFLRLPDGALQLGVVVALSLTLDMLVGQALLSVHNISGSAGACILAGMTCIRPVRSRPSSSKDQQ